MISPKIVQSASAGMQQTAIKSYNTMRAILACNGAKIDNSLTDKTRYMLSHLGYDMSAVKEKMAVSLQDSALAGTKLDAVV